MDPTGVAPAGLLAVTLALIEVIRNRREKRNGNGGFKETDRTELHSIREMLTTHKDMGWSKSLDGLLEQNKTNAKDQRENTDAILAELRNISKHLALHRSVVDAYTRRLDDHMSRMECVKPPTPREGG